MFLPFMGVFYDRVAQPLGWMLFRVLIGGALVYEGWPKIIDPLGQVGFVENLGFYPGWLWSPLLAAMQFFGGFAIAAGFLTRPIALANAVMLAITLWFHVSFPYGDRLVTDAGFQVLSAGGAELLTSAGARRLADGGQAFLGQVQEKAEMASLLWTGGAAFFAAFGGGIWSVDRCLMKKEF
ncbi:DoxX family protein [Humitalea rosea]|nr:DoxX family protein [Humitalea rosea]